MEKYLQQLQTHLPPEVADVLAPVTETIQQIPYFDWLFAAGVGFVLYLILEAVRGMLLFNANRVAKRVRGPIGDVPCTIIGSISHWYLMVVGLFVAGAIAPLAEQHTNWLEQGFVLLTILQVALVGQALLKMWFGVLIERQRAKDKSGVAIVSVGAFVARGAMWGVVLLLALDNMGIDITAMVAGVGIGGIAIAMAAQNILSDLFASLSIIMDKPFAVGDFIIEGTTIGTVEHIGLKNTRLRAVSGEEIVVANSDLLGSRIHNYRKMKERRGTIMLGVEYGTPAAKLKKIPGIVEKIITKEKQVRFDRCHFKSFGDFSLNFEVVFYVEVPEYPTFMDIQQAINLAIYEAFAKEDIGFAFPTQTLHVEGQLKGVKG